MFFFGNDTSVNEEEDNIEILISRLEHSEYVEDKMDALYELEKYADKNILETGTYGLLPLIESIPDLQDISYNLKILHKVFTSVYSDEFVDLLIKNHESLDILISNRKKDYEGLYNLMKVLVLNKEFCKRLVLVKNVAHYCVKQIEFGRLEMIQNMINLSHNFDKEIVFEGVFEKLINLFTDSVENHQNNLSEDIINLISKLIENNHFNQNYFIETDWNKLPVNNDTMMIFCGLVDNTNNNVNYIKDSLYRYIKFSKALEIKEYEYIYNMILESTKYLNLFFEIYYSDDAIRGDVTTNDAIRSDVVTNDVINDGLVNNDVINDDHINDHVIIIIWYLINNRILRFKKNGFEYLICSEILKYYSDKLIEDSKRYTKICKKSEYDKYERSIQDNPDLLSHILLLFSFRNIDHSLNISLTNINENTVIYFIILSNTEDIKENSAYIIDKINSENIDKTLKKYYIFLCILHNININYNKFHKKKFLKDFRRLISEEDINSEYFIIEEAKNILLDKINEMICLY
jgi:hypothetical protein